VRNPFHSIASRIALASILVTLAALVVIAYGVLAVSQSQFQKLMVEHGSTAAEAHAMFDQTVTAVFVLVLLVASVVSVGLAVLLARRLSRPLEAIGQAARTIAAGEYRARVPRSGPEEIVSLADSFNQMAESLEDQERLRRDFIINAAHELRTPLTNIEGYLEALRDGVVAPDRSVFASLHEEADRLVRLSRSLDALAEGEHLPAAELRELDLSEALRSSIEIARPAFDRRSIRLQLRIREQLRVQANPDHLAQILANLLQNAARYTPHDGAVTVLAEARPTDVLISLTNTGDGIPAKDLPHVFERFYRVEKSRDRTKGGDGIGLAIVKELVEAAGGQVGAESVAGITRFWVSLPA
jgi:signal transduction histidine kinase